MEVTFYVCINEVSLGKTSTDVPGIEKKSQITSLDFTILEAKFVVGQLYRSLMLVWLVRLECHMR